MLDKLNAGIQEPLSLELMLINLLVGCVLAFILKYHFLKFSSVLSNRKEFASVFPFILLVTILIITIVKSSLALSLGLVGALSIVRFRTPIKEPEELAYLFMAIAIGLGLGASQTVPTIVASMTILLMMGVFKASALKNQSKNLYFSISTNSGESDGLVEKINEILSDFSNTVDLRRVDISEHRLHAIYFLDLDSATKVESVFSKVKEINPSVEISFIDQNNMPSV